jgi:uncharacterized protein YndB with AHSA1/START domain
VRDLAATPERAYQAFANPEAKAKWFASPAAWEQSRVKMEFKVGGKEFVSGTPPGHKPHTFDCTYLDIVPNVRIIYLYEMHIGEAKISASLATVEFAASGKGTKLKFTEQGVFLDGYDDSGSRERGTIGLMDRLEASLKPAA